MRLIRVKIRYIVPGTHLPLICVSLTYVPCNMRGHQKNRRTHNMWARLLICNSAKGKWTKNVIYTLSPLSLPLIVCCSWRHWHSWCCYWKIGTLGAAPEHTGTLVAAPTTGNHHHKASSAPIITSTITTTWHIHHPSSPTQGIFTHHW